MTRKLTSQSNFASINLSALAAMLAILLAGCAADPLPPSENLPWEVALTGGEFRWEVTDPGRDGKLGTPDDLHFPPPLHLPANTPARVLLRSRDFLYTFELPAQQIKEIALPDRTYSVEFPSGKPREIEFRGDQFCGYAHTALSGMVLIQNWRDYRRWQDDVESKQPTR